MLITRDPQLAEDAVTEAFLTAFRRIRSFDRGRPFGPWFFRVVANTALKLLARQSREIPLSTVASSDGALGPRVGAAGEGLTDWTTRVEDRDTVLQAVRRLPAKQRAAIALRYFADMDERAISEVLHVPRGTGSRDCSVDWPACEKPLATSSQPRGERQERCRRQPFGSSSRRKRTRSLGQTSTSGRASRGTPRLKEHRP